MSLRINDNGIERNMTAEEEAAHLVYAESVKAEQEAQAAAKAEKNAARNAVLTKLGLSAEEAAALLG